jgi:hypothetical protein
LLDQFVAELATDDRAYLSNFLGDGPEPIEAREQRGMQRGGDRSLGQRACFQHRGDLAVPVATFEHRLGQLFDEQRYAVSAFDDLIYGLAR